jgi:serine/threonine protein kinase
VGPTYRAIDERLDRPVVLKAIRAADLVPAGEVGALRDAFRTRAQTAAKVQHPNIATIYSYERLDVLDLMVMEQVEGGTLRAHLALGERWSAMDAARLMALVADAVAAAHEHGIAHGRLTLANIKLRPDSRVKLLDLGVPRAADFDAAPDSGDAMRNDVAALGRITCQIIAGAMRAEIPGHTASENDLVLVDPTQVWSNFGMLAPVLGRALGFKDNPYPDAGAFRDALVELLQENRRTQAGLDAAGDQLTPADVLGDEAVPVSALYSGEGRGPALVLPPDLTGLAPLPPDGAYLVMELPDRLDRLRTARERLQARIGSIPRQRAVAAVIAAVLVAGAALTVRYFMASGGARAEIPDASTPPALESRMPAPSVASLPPAPDRQLAAAAVADSALSDPPREENRTPAETTRISAERESTSETRDRGSSAAQTGRRAAQSPAGRDREPVMRSGSVRVRPPGTLIRVANQVGAWTTQADFSVPEGDSLIVMFSRPGYLPEQRVFRGTDITVELRPDSVNVAFDSNMPAEIFVETAAGWRSLGSTNTTVRMPTGTHRIAFRTQDQPEWIQQHSFPSAGRTYRVQKLDYPTRGGLVVTIPLGWAYVSVDGGADQESPHTFENLTAGPHIVRISRPGYQTIIDTVRVRAGQRLSRQYQLVPREDE